MLALWIVLILLASYLISLSVASSIKIDSSLDQTSVIKAISKRDKVRNIAFGLSALIMLSIWGTNKYFSVYPSHPFTPIIAKELIAANDDDNYVECVNSFSGDKPGYSMMRLKDNSPGDFSVSEVKLVCTCIKEKYDKTNDYKLYTGLVYWKECTTYCQTDSCKIGREYFKNEYEEVVFELGKILYPP